MTAAQLGILVVGGLAGWWVVSYVFDRQRGADSQPQPPRDATRAPGPEQPANASVAGTPMSTDTAPTGDDAELSFLELADRWPEILRLPRTATVAEIEAAYAARRLELDRRRFDTSSTERERQETARELRRLESAYEFVRFARAGSA